jgi:hypothetical protein
MAAMIPMGIGVVSEFRLANSPLFSSPDEAGVQAILPNDKTEKQGGTLCQITGLNQTKRE